MHPCCIFSLFIHHLHVCVLLSGFRFATSLHGLQQLQPEQPTEPFTPAQEQDSVSGARPAPGLGDMSSVTHLTKTKSPLLIRHIPKHPLGPGVCLCAYALHMWLFDTHITLHLTSLLSGPITSFCSSVGWGTPLRVAHLSPPQVWRGGQKDKHTALTWIYQCLLSSVPHLTQGKKICIQKS